MIEKIKIKALSEINAIKDKNLLEKIEIKYLGRNGEVTQILRSLKDLSIEEKRKIGPLAQKLKIELEEKIEEKLKSLAHSSSSIIHGLDITKPAKKIETGHLHPLSKIEEEVRQIFLAMNFSVVEGPEVESEYYNFDALNIPRDHPAREMHDTFWLKQPEINKKNSRRHLLLRTHISALEVPFMEKNQPPFQFISPGNVFRYEASDASHDMQFNYMEGMMVGKDISLANFKFIVETFFKKFFGKDMEFRFRPSYFPFVEPGLEVDIKFKDKKQNTEKWLEVMGAGMTHAQVFRYAHYNPYDWQGFAFGVGLDRLCMLKYKINDIRVFRSNDLRFTKQF